MVKKAISLIIVLIIIMIPSVAYADTFNSVSIEQVDTNLPEIAAFFYFLDKNGEPMNTENVSFDKENVTAMLGGSPLEVKSIGNAEDYPVTYYYLLDVSTSVSTKMLNKIKGNIVKRIENASNNEKNIVITFGKEINVILDGTETPESAAKKLDKVKPNEHATRLFDGLDKMLTLSANDGAASRKIAILVSDGKDLYEGGATKEDVLERIQEENISLYSFAMPNSTKGSKEAMREVSKKSGGDMMMIKSDNTEACFREFDERMNCCFRIELATESNIVSGTRQDFVLKISYNGFVLESMYTVKSTKWIPDNVPPEIIDCESFAQNKITVKFSENVVGADNPLCYSVTDDNGEKYEVVSASYGAEDFTAILIMDKVVYNGMYFVEANGIKDVSMEENSITGEAYKLELSEKGRDRPLTVGEKAIKYWYVSATIVFFLALAIAGTALLIKKDKKKREEQKNAEKIANEELLKKTALEATKQAIAESKPSQSSNIKVSTMESAPAKRVTLVISCDGTAQRSIDVLINGKYTMGRSQKCNLSFNDQNMSREHCALDYRDGTLLVQDLGSTNGTFINGVLIKGMYSVNDGDEIRFGRAKVIVRFIMK